MNLAKLRLFGFDNSKHIPFTTMYRVKCSQCESTSINGMPCHETGCPNTMHECKGCNEIIPMHERYCEDCRG